MQVIDSGGLSAAGRVLGLAPTLVSRRIAKLEDDVGVPLLLRTTRTLRVTDEGRNFYQRCRQILDDLDEAVRAASPNAGELQGRVRAVLPTATTAVGIMDGVGELLEKHPGLSLQCSFSDRPVDMVAGGWDVAVHAGSPKDSTHIVRRLKRVNTQLAATHDYLARAGIPQRPQDLSSHQCLRFISDLPQDTWRLVHEDGREEVVSVDGRLESDNSATLRDAMNAGLGIGLNTSGTIERAIDEGRLARVLPEWTMSALDLYMLIPSGRNSVPRVRVFADWLEGFIRSYF